jgi:mycoredoxin
MSPVTMYSTTWCGYCRRLKLQIDAAGVAYDEINIERDPEAAAFVESVNGGNRPTVRFPDGSALTNPSMAGHRQAGRAGGVAAEDHGSHPGCGFVHRT